MKFYKIISLILAVLMLMNTFAACGLNDNPDDSKTEINDSDSNTNNVETDIETVDLAEEALGRLTNIDWGGDEFCVLFTNDIVGYSEEFEAEAKATNQTSSAIINDAVYERNILLGELCNLTFVPVRTTNLSISTQVNAECQTNTGDFDLITAPASTTAKMGTSGYLYNYMDMNIDYEQPWWDPGTLNFSLDGNLFFMNGAHNIVDDDLTFVFMFNKTLQEEAKIEDPYTTVRNQNWTLDYFNTIIQNVSAENGDGVWDEKDTYGFSTPCSIGTTLFYGSGLRYISNSRDMDYPQLALSDQLQKATLVLEKAQSIVHDNNASYMAKIGHETLSRDVFVEERALFYCEAASYLRALAQTMEGDYGVVPVPKFDKAQKNYLTWTHDLGSTLSIPTSIADEIENQQFEEVLETYVILSYQLIKPAYYETMLTHRNVRDPDSSEMLDLIFQNRIYDMAMYFTDLGFSQLFMNCVVDNADNFSSKYKANSNRFDKLIEKILEKIRT